MAFNYNRVIDKADKLIQKFGIAAELRREGIPDRPCRAVLIEYSPREKGLRLENARRALVSRLDPTTRQPLAIPPDHEHDLLIFAGDVLRIMTPDSGPRPSGVAIYHDLEVVYDSRDV